MSKRKSRERDQGELEPRHAKRLIDICATSIDPETYLFYHGVFCAAAQLDMPVENPASKPVLQVGNDVYAFSDRPLNRGMLAVVKEMRGQNYTENQKQAYLWRLMEFPAVFAHSETLSRFLKPTDEPGTTSVQEALIKACATAKLVFTDDKVHFDIDDLIRIAGEYMDAEEAAELESATAQGIEPRTR